MKSLKMVGLMQQAFYGLSTTFCEVYTAKQILPSFNYNGWPQNPYQKFGFNQFCYR